MLDTDTFLTELYVMIGDLCNANLPPECHPGREVSRKMYCGFS